jgi:hypothetical protein
MLQFLLLYCYLAQADCSPCAVHSLGRPHHILHGMGKIRDPPYIWASSPSSAMTLCPCYRLVPSAGIPLLRATNEAQPMAEADSTA